MISRRQFVQTVLAASAAQSLVGAGEKRAPRILLRSSWQVVNIGDIAHTPGVLALIEKYIPAAEVILWASADITPEVIAMEHKRFHKLRVVKGSLRVDGKASTPELEEAVEWADFFLHGSGPGLVGGTDLAAFFKRTGKPFGIYGITYSQSSLEIKELLGLAKFFYFRDSVSLAKARADGITSPVMDFCPDAAFATDLRDDASAIAFLSESELEEGKFLCCIARLRNTPYWTIKAERAFDEEKNARNLAMMDHDGAPLRAAIAAVVRETDLKVLLCPEDMTQMQVSKEMLYDQLPEDVKKRVVWRKKFWLTDEALSTYIRSAGLFGHEMHSPIMCIGNGIPAIVCRWKEQTSKGFMWRDIGLEDWLFDFDSEEEMERMPSAVLAMAKDLPGARAKAEQARAFVQKRQQATMAELARQLSAL